MRIAQIAPPWLPVPPPKYGGTELVVSYLTEELVRRGHEVTLFAPADSKTSANLFSSLPKSLRGRIDFKSKSLFPMLQYIECFARAGQFDMIHNHGQFETFFLAELIKTPVVHTIHGSYDGLTTSPDRMQTLTRFKNHNFVSISGAQRRGFPELNYAGTVFNGINIHEFNYSKKKGNYLFWISRMAPDKGPIDAIKAAQKLKMELKISAAINSVNLEYYQNKVKPLIDGKLIKFNGEVAHKDKSKVYKNALCTLFPIHWEEPFGLVMIESMACGTPVIAYNRGSVSEVVRDGVTGFIIDPDNKNRPKKGSWVIKKQGIAGLVEAVRRVGEIDRQMCRKHVEENFTVNRMVDRYEKIYEKILGQIKEKNKSNTVLADYSFL
ncbi:MAG: glycosyltransferase family 4 protein [Candidatus Levybacteria bacterium]|nr:glycosyltransferase family 4 protein [Candidatus Levybacteria bacterium]